jgi:UDP-N-acetylglucosamine 2-epimerase (non-hydrolysing)
MIVDLVYGTRPNIIKAAALYVQWQENRAQTGLPFKIRLIDTGQHWDQNLSADQCATLGLPAPDVHLAIGQTAQQKPQETAIPLSRTQMIARAQSAYADHLKQSAPDVTIVIGDVNGSLGVARAAKANGIYLCHLEAGLRGGIDAVAEEANRIEIDQISDDLWAPDLQAKQNLLTEGIPESRIHLTGNAVIDTLIRFGAKSEKKADPTTLVTLHRAENVDHPARLRAITESLMELSLHHRLVWPLHPRTRYRLSENNLLGKISKASNVELLPPLCYSDFAIRLTQSVGVITDSGGVIEECAWLGKPTLIVRPASERLHMVEFCGFELVEPENLVHALNVQSRKPIRKFRPHGWDGRAAQRMIDRLSEICHHPQPVTAH